MAEATRMKLTRTGYGQLFDAAFMIRKPWQISSMSLSKAKRCLEVVFDFCGEHVDLCPFCGAPLVDLFFPSDKKWNHLNFFQYETCMRASIPLFRCSNGKCVARTEREAVLNTLFL